MKTIFPILAFLLSFVVPADAEQSGHFTHTVVVDGDGVETVEITGYPGAETDPNA